MSEASFDAEPLSGLGQLPLRDARDPLSAGHYNELRDANGWLRAEWRQFGEAVDELSPAALLHASRYAVHQIHESGVSYNVYADQGAARAWNLDVLPALLTPGDWITIERGVRQRARLADALAADLYSGQQVLHSRLIPPPLVLSHPRFLRACHGIAPPGGCYVHLAAFDLARTPDGAWRVAGERTQAPSGLGYALENRRIISRLFPDAVRALGVRPLTPFCDAFQDALLANAPVDGETPTAVLLTPGAFNETYFEHVYLARELGIPLVEGSDLTVRDDRVFLKTVAGLAPVHAIWRRVDDDYCDPLELRGDSWLGVSGLVQAWRAGRILIANALGTSVVEAPALAAFLPEVCERLLGESLEMPSITTTWCGSVEPPLTPADTCVIQSAWSSSMPPVFMPALDDCERDLWRARVLAAPGDYAVREFVPLSHAPTWQDGAIVNRPIAIRVFALTDGRGGYHVMPGGLCRVAGDNRALSMQRGGSSKDTWVISDGQQNDARMADASPRVHPMVHSERTTSSRAAESLYWLGRYAERSENTARLLRQALGRVTGTAPWPAACQPLLLKTCLKNGILSTTGLPSKLADRFQMALSAIEHGLIDGLRDRDARQGLRFNVQETVRVAASVRHRLSSDNWRILGRLAERVVDDQPARPHLNDTLDVIDDVILALVAAGGLEMAHMTRDDGWKFLSLGRHLERLAFIATTITDVQEAGATSEPLVLEWLLDLSDSLITYKARYLRRPEWPAVVDLLIFDERNPRLAMFQVGKLDKHVRALPDANLIDVLADIERLRQHAAHAEDAQGQLFETVGRSGTVASTCRDLALSLSDALTLRYFSHVSDRAETVGTR